MRYNVGRKREVDRNVLMHTAPGKLLPMELTYSIEKTVGCQGWPNVAATVSSLLNRTHTPVADVQYFHQGLHVHIL